MYEIDITAPAPPPTADAAIRAAHTKQRRRAIRDEAMAVEFSVLVRGGHTTETARRKMNIGIVKAKRLRTIAVRHGWLRARQRKAGLAPFMTEVT